jgi:hypothetical protein
MVEDEATLVELRMGRMREEYKRKALWGMQGSCQVLKIENLFLRMLFCWIIVISLYSTVPMISWGKTICVIEVI